jgi:hypothetical protein
MSERNLPTSLLLFGLSEPRYCVLFHVQILSPRAIPVTHSSEVPLKSCQLNRSMQHYLIS